jgi:hypothetical protein
MGIDKVTEEIPVEITVNAMDLFLYKNAISLFNI